MRIVTKFLLFGAFLMLLNLTLYAQVNPGNFKLIFEKVYLHTDRDLYTGGEDIWLKAYLVNAQNNQPIAISNNLYVELIAPDASILSREILRLDNGTGKGDIKLNDSIPTGKYRLRAYTNWMRNFGDNFVFEKEISIVNNATITDVVSQVKPAAKKLSKLNLVALANSPIVRFFPEGGSLVNGLSSTVAVKAEDAMGTGLAVSGELLSSSGRTVAKFICDSLGMGSFSLWPDDTQTYSATINYNGEKTIAVIPNALYKGFTINANIADSTILLTLSCNGFALQQSAGNYIIITIKHGGKVYYQDRLKVTTNSMLLQIPDAHVPEGVACITLYDEHSKPLAERLLYIHHPGQTQLTVSSDKAQYASKEKVSVKIKLSDTVKTRLSMAVVDAGVVPAQTDDIASYLLLQSEVRGKIAQPQRYFDPANPNRFKQLDLLLLTQGWRDYVWQRIADTAIRLSYAAESGFTVSGRVRQKFGDHPVNNMNITLTAFKAVGDKLYTAKTDSTGKFYIDGLQLHGPQHIKVTARNNKGIREGWLLIDSLYNDPIAAYKLKTATAIDSAIAKPLNKRQTDLRDIAIKTEGRQLKEVKITAKRNVIMVDRLDIGPLATFGYPDEAYDIKPKDMEFKTVEWYLLQNCPAPKQDINIGLAFIMFGQKIKPYFIVNQKYDPYFPTDLILGLGLDKVKKIIVRHLVTMGGSDVFLIYVNTLPGAFDSKDFGAELANVNGYYEARNFYKPIYDGKEDATKPDLRTTIHWEPNITTDAKGEATVSFYNADPKGKVRVIVQGVTDKGVPVASVVEYLVK